MSLPVASVSEWAQPCAQEIWQCCWDLPQDIWLSDIKVSQPDCPTAKHWHWHWHWLIEKKQTISCSKHRSQGSWLRYNCQRFQDHVRRQLATNALLSLAPTCSTDTCLTATSITPLIFPMLPRITKRTGFYLHTSSGGLPTDHGCLAVNGFELACQPASYPSQLQLPTIYFLNRAMRLAQAR